MNKRYKLWAAFVVTVFAFGACKKKKEKYFEGYLLRRHELLLKKGKGDTNQSGDTIRFYTRLYFKDGNFLDRPEGYGGYELLFRRDSNILYEKKIGTDTLHWVDFARSVDTPLRYTHTPKKETVAGVLCDELMVYFPSKKVTIYFNPNRLKVNPLWFSRCQFYNDSFYFQHTRALFYKMISERSDQVYTFTVMQAVETPVNEANFVIPAYKHRIEVVKQ